VALFAVAALLAVGAVLAYRFWPVPSRIDACGRAFGHRDGSLGAGPFTFAQVRARDAGLVKIRDLKLGREVWAHPGCGLGIYLRTGDNRFLGYGLLGGP
jgi:hypothetical protein